MAKCLFVIAAAITTLFVIAILAGPDQGIDKGISGQRITSIPANVPEMINYQGVLTDADGNPLDTTVSMTFSIYGSETGGTALWSGTMNNVSVNGGLFTVLLDIPPENFEDADRWMGVTVGDDGEMTPRQRIASVPYAYRCGNGSAGEGCWECPGAPYSGPVYTLLNTVGIGTDNPTAIDAGRTALHVAGPLTPAFVLEQTDYSPRKWDILTSGLDGALTIRDRTAGSTAYRMIIDPDGHVGIGTTEPEIRLHVTDDAHAVKGENDESEGYLGHSLPGIPSDIRVGVYGEHTPSGNYGYIGSQSYGVYGKSSTGYAGCFVGDVYTSGDVGIGTMSPVAKLDVVGGIALKYGNALTVRESYAPGTSNILKTGWDENRGDYLDLYVPGAGAPNEGAKMSLTENGYVGIGTTNPQVGLHIKGKGSWGHADIRLESDNDYSWNIGAGENLWIAYMDGVYHDYLVIDTTGNVSVKVLKITSGSDISEPFDVVEPDWIEPGMVVAIDPEHPGKLKVSHQAYDRCVAGIISGAGGIQPGLTLTQENALSGDHQVALTGRVYGLCDASYGPIEAGDLLTTSPTPGYAMKVTDFEQARGAVLGKAMTTLERGRGLVLTLVCLQ